MSLGDKLRKSILPIIGLTAAVGLTYLGHNALRNYGDSRAKFEALETCIALVEEMREKHPNNPPSTFIANLKNEGIDYKILVEIGERRLTIERKLGSDSSLVFVDDEIDGKLDRAYILRTAESKNLEVYNSKTPNEFEGMFRRELKSIWGLLREYKERKVKPIGKPGQHA
ncbi:MAG: hypothetical protein Q7R87_02125 [Nanoarchaeota archaeon]|nr:hypothetical protein [Nanoarchaeota archaeon]